MLKHDQIQAQAMSNIKGNFIFSPSFSKISIFRFLRISEINKVNVGKRPEIHRKREKERCGGKG